MGGEESSDGGRGTTGIGSGGGRQRSRVTELAKDRCLRQRRSMIGRHRQPAEVSHMPLYQAHRQKSPWARHRQ